MRYKAAIIIISDRCSKGERADESSPALKRCLEKDGYEIVSMSIVPDDFETIAETLRQVADSGEASLILTTGGTGFSPRDVTPEATKSVIEKECPGICEMIRYESAKITKMAYLSRGIAGIRRKTLIINLPGSPKGAVESFQAVRSILEHALDILLEKPEAH